jgi:hypothetical protein
MPGDRDVVAAVAGRQRPHEQGPSLRLVHERPGGGLKPGRLQAMISQLTREVAVRHGLGLAPEPFDEAVEDLARLGDLAPAIGVGAAFLEGRA